MIPDPHHRLNQFREWVKDEARWRGDISPGDQVIDHSFTKMIGRVVAVDEDSQTVWVKFSDGHNVLRKLSEVELAP